MTDLSFTEQFEAEIAALQKEMQGGATANAEGLSETKADDLFGDFAELRKLVVDGAEKEDARARQELHREREASGQKFTPQTDDEKRAKRQNYKATQRKIKQAEQLEHIAVLDMETDPFDTDNREIILPFTACLYSKQFAPIFIWEEHYPTFVDKLVNAIESLPGKYIIYAHNGGRFDFMFLMHKLRGKVMFKGRGIMSAQLGNHELRDSYHLIPEKLAGFHKEKFDYENMRKGKRNKHKQAILDYLLSDCEYLYDIVISFLTNYGIKISIGQAAFTLMRREYPEYQTISEQEDRFIRDFFFGGRVECFQGCGTWTGDYELDDVNSMYPDAMCRYFHPIGKQYNVRNKGDVREKTCFVDLNCYSAGAFPLRNPDTGSTEFPHQFGRFKVSVHEYRVAKELRLIRNVKINYVVDNERMSKFDKFILPFYAQKESLKDKLDDFKKQMLSETSDIYLDAKKDYMFSKFFMNNSYGKNAQNPRRFKEYCVTDWDARPEETGWGDFPESQTSEYAIWSRPQTELKFNNVGTAASITGAARATLLWAIHHSEGLLYCDTDSLICKKLTGVKFHPRELGAWDIEAKINHIMIAGKKLYAYRTDKGIERIKSKGVKGVTWEMMEQIVSGKELIVSAFAPTLTRDGEQRYIDRTVRATTQRKI